MSTGRGAIMSKVHLAGGHNVNSTYPAGGDSVKNPAGTILYQQYIQLGVIVSTVHPTVIIQYVH
jgi:hypothetical protein